LLETPQPSIISEKLGATPPDVAMYDRMKARSPACFGVSEYCIFCPMLHFVLAG